MNYRNRLWMIGLVIGVFTGIFTGCQHSRALYEDPPKSALEQGQIAEKKHRYQEAEQRYEQITDLTVKTMALNRLASAWDSVNASLVRSQTMVNQQPAVAKYRLQLAQDYYHKGLLCTRYNQESLGDYPRDFVRGEAEYYYNQALEHAKYAIYLQSDLPDAHLLIGEVYLANRMTAKAVEALKVLIGAHPDFAPGYYALGKVYLESKNYDLCERYFIKAIKLDPTLYDAYYLLGQFFLEQNLSEYAAYTFLEILRNVPQDAPAFEMLVEACHELGKEYIKLQRYDDAVRLFQQVLKTKSSYPIHESLLLAQQKKREAEELKQQQADLQQVTPPQESPEISKFKALLFADQKLEALLLLIDTADDPELGQAIQLFQKQAFQEGYDLLLTSPEKNRTNPYRPLALAYALQQLNRPDDAKNELRQITTQKDADSRVQLWAWLALRGLGEELDQNIIYRVLGVIIEVYIPEKQGVDTLGIYLDGRVRYVNASGNMLVWDRTDGQISDNARSVVYTAQAIARDFPSEQQRVPLTQEKIRITLLTCGGIRALEENETAVRQQTSMISPVFKVGTDLLETIFAIAKGE